MDTDLLLLLVLIVFAIWFFIDLLRYVDILGQMSQTDREKHIFGKVLRPETRTFMLCTFVSALSSKRFIVILIFIVLIMAGAKLLGICFEQPCG